MRSTTLSLIVPDLIDPVPSLQQLPAQDLPDLPVFSLFLSRGRRIIPDVYDNGSNNFYTCLLRQLSSKTDFPRPPIASVSYYYDTQTFKHEPFPSLTDLKDKWIMRIDPCYMVADRDQLVLAKTGDLDLSLHEAQQLVEEINQFYGQFDDTFWTLIVISPQRWYLISDKAIHIETTPPEKVIGRSLKSYLFSGTKEEKKYWLQLFNEFQMIFHQSSINKHRLKNNKIPINSVWFWGQDDQLIQVNSMSESSSLTADRVVYTDKVFAQGLALLTGSCFNQVPEQYLSETKNSGKENVYIIGDFAHAMLNQDVFNWVGLVQQFEQNYLKPILNDINSGKISQLELLSPTGSKLIVTRKLLRRWWRKKKKYNLFL